MKKGSAMEGFICEDGTLRPIEHYDDTELRGKIQTNTDNISNLNSRVTELEEHGGVEDPTKADKVEDATAGNLASLDEEGNLQDSGKKPADFADADHEHNYIADFSGSDNCGASVNVGEGDPGAGVITLSVKGNGQSTDSKTAEIDYYGIDNLNRAIADPVKSTDASPTYSDDTLITAGAVYAALAGKMDDKTIDSTPANNATHLISSKAVYDYKVLQLPDIILLVLKLAAAEEIDDNLSWDTIDTSAHYYSATSLTVSDINAYKIGDICKVSNGTTTIYAKVTGVDHSYSAVTFNDAFTSMTTSTITISKLS